MADSIPAQATQDKGDFVQQYMDDKRWVEEPELMPWYVKELTDLEPATRKLFETYSNVPSDEVVSHIKKVRDKAFRVVSLPTQRMLETVCCLLHWPTSYVPQFPYPCLGHWGFLNLSIGTSNAYQEILDRVKNGEQYLDLGCCVGQDIRKLVSNGAPSENTYGSDLKASFWDIGFELFRDKSSLKTTFIEADILDANSNLHKLDGKVDIINAASFFHLFDWNGQIATAKAVVQLLKPSSGSLLVGRQGGRVEAGEFNHQVGSDKSLYWHNPDSFARLWKQVGDETGTEWEVNAYFDENIDMRRKARGGLSQFIPTDSKMLKFTVRRV
jgi:hypothetical protein